MSDRRPNTPPATIHLGDCIEVMRTLPENSVDAIVTDPPYGLGFMGKEWDELPPGEEWARECLRVLKPGGHLLAFGGSRTWHRLAVAVEDAGFEVRDSIAWLYGSGFPKSLDVSKAIDKAAGAEREVIGYRKNLNRTAKRGEAGAFHSSEGGMFREDRDTFPDTAPATDDARKWAGFGTALKPAFEPIVVARKPLVGTVAANVLAHGTGALNIDGCRVESEEGRAYPPSVGGTFRLDGFSSIEDLEAAALRGDKTPYGRDAATTLARWRANQETQPKTSTTSAGRWPANVVLDESQAAALDQMSGVQRDGVAVRRNGVKESHLYGSGMGECAPGSADLGYGGSGGASRFFYVAKAPTRERPKVDGIAHPTVKPLALMRWLVRLVTPPGGTVLEPFAGSGTTVEACALEGFACIAIEREPDYLPLIQARLARVEAAQPEPAGPSLFDIEATA